MKFSIVLAVAALSAETFACANIGQVCQKGDPDVCQCDAPLTLSCRGDLATRPGGGECPCRWLNGHFLRTHKNSSDPSSSPLSLPAWRHLSPAQTKWTVRQWEVCSGPASDGGYPYADS
ncbi:hypothetical protein FOPG_08707 [Fusarium oxysporum f. sp. conglutinans race 2 54008]|uniref:Extracellular membrane protein CFEM domain-containing protein n=1 Tax=Fusarium oxysporum f. sp. conglutinans race 2 54008 TaxID=1089457 RepID=X0IUB6_FUSOX|nr:hypothetical protein FOPG_08707 [Fusarium oxysporum f. sp. conglutinans race 2 54008]KAJ4061720.1 hypothetical protein NW763_005111 [Fusarium oxysporum]KAJ4085794.1 hypothetical protein NW761_008909 [Fusarium oxysporum]